MKDCMAINKNIKFLLSPWTPPLWMKTNYKWQGSSGAMLRVDCYDVYAQYLVKTIQGYEAAGIPIYALTIQNEPQGRVGWPGLHLGRRSDGRFHFPFPAPRHERQRDYQQAVGLGS